MSLAGQHQNGDTLFFYGGDKEGERYSKIQCDTVCYVPFPFLNGL